MSERGSWIYENGEPVKAPAKRKKKKDPREEMENAEQLTGEAPDSVSLEAIKDRLLSLCKTHEACDCVACKAENQRLLKWIDHMIDEKHKCKYDGTDRPWNQQRPPHKIVITLEFPQ